MIVASLVVAGGFPVYWKVDFARPVNDFNAVGQFSFRYVASENGSFPLPKAPNSRVLESAGGSGKYTGRCESREQQFRPSVVQTVTRSGCMHKNRR